MDRSARLRQARDDRRLTRAQLATAAGISESYVRHLETGERQFSPEVAERLGAALGIELRTEHEIALANAKEVLRVPPMKRREIEHHAEAIVAHEYPEVVAQGLPVPVAQAFADLPGIAQRLGIAAPVIVDTFESRVDGVTWCNDRAGPIYCQVRADLYDRAQRGEAADRWALAHEIAHPLLHAPVLLAEPGAMFRDVAVSKPSERAVAHSLKVYEIADWQANAWAAAFLLSTAAIRAYLRSQHALGNEVVVENIARHFEVSVPVAEFRMSTALPALGQ